MIRSLARLWSIDPGFNPHNVMTVGLSLPPSMMAATPDAVRSAFREFDNRIAAIPGVQAVSQTWGAVPLGDDDERTFWLEGQPKPASQDDMSWAINYIVEPGYLKAMEIPLLRGRFFTDQDNEHSPPVVVVDDVFARKFFPNENPIGKRIISGNFADPAQIVGVVGHVKQWGLDMDDTQKLRAQFYISCMQMPDSFVAMQSSGSALIVRSNQAGTGLLDSIRHASQQISNQQIIFGPQTMDQIIADSLAERRFSMILFGVFAALALSALVLDAFEMIFVVIPVLTPPLLVRVPDAPWVAVLLLLILQTSFLVPPLGYAVILVRTALGRSLPMPAFARALAPYVLVQVATLITVLAWPGLVWRGFSAFFRIPTPMRWTCACVGPAVARRRSRCRRRALPRSLHRDDCGGSGHSQNRRCISSIGSKLSHTAAHVRVEGCPSSRSRDRALHNCHIVSRF